MKVLLVNPPLKSENPYEPAPFPLGLGYLAAALRQAGHKPIILDACLGPARKAADSRHYDIGLDHAQILSAAQEAKPDLIGVGVPFTSRLKAAIEIGRLLRSAFPDLPMVAGGLHATVAPQDLLMNGFDTVILGEAEWSFPAYLSGVAAGKQPVIPNGIGWREGDQIRIEPQVQHPVDLDNLPFPARDLVDYDAYLRRSGGRWIRQGARVASVLSSRGCPYRCTYCSAFRLTGRKYRRRSPQNVLEEIEWLLTHYRITHVAFEDDNLTADRKWAIEIFEGMVRRFPRLKWLTPNGVSIRNLDRELLAVMKRCGCKTVNLAFESGDAHILHDVMKKDHELEEGGQARAWCRELGINVNGCFVLGMPGETLESMQRTMDYALSMDLDGIGIFIATPFPGTELYDMALQNGYLDQAYAEGGALFASDPQVLHEPLIETPWLSKAQLMDFAEHFRREFFRNYHAHRPLSRIKRAAVTIVRRVLPR